MADASATNHNAWRRRMRKPRQQSSSSIEPEAEARGPARGLSRKSSREASSNLVGGRRIHCAIYTRKSSEEGLEQEFNSLDAHSTCTPPASPRCGRKRHSPRGRMLIRGSRTCSATAAEGSTRAPSANHPFTRIAPSPCSRRHSALCGAATLRSFAFRPRPPKVGFRQLT
jgi:hypothetical protein